MMGKLVDDDRMLQDQANGGWIVARWMAGRWRDRC